MNVEGTMNWSHFFYIYKHDEFDYLGIIGGDLRKD